MLEELTKKFLSKRKSNQNVKAKRGSSREVYFEVNWEWFGGVFRAATLKFEHRLRYEFLSWNSFSKSTFFRTSLKTFETKVVSLRMSLLRQRRSCKPVPSPQSKFSKCWHWSCTWRNNHVGLPWRPWGWSCHLPQHNENTDGWND